MRAQRQVAAAGAGTQPSQARLTRPDGVLRNVSTRRVPLRSDGRVTGYLGTLEDITDRKSLEERLEHDATHDRLTGLGSRALLVEELNSALARTRAQRSRRSRCCSSISTASSA